MVAKEAIDQAIQKLPIKARFVTREEVLLMADARTELAELDLTTSSSTSSPTPRHELFKLRFQQRHRAAREHAELHGVRRQIARIMTDAPARDRGGRGQELAMARRRPTRLTDAERRGGHEARRPRPARSARASSIVDQDGQDRRRRDHRPCAPPEYAKTVQRTKKLYVHDEANDAQCRRPGPCPGDPARCRS